MLTLEIGRECSAPHCGSDHLKICEVTVVDDVQAKKQTVLEGKSACEAREAPSQPLRFIGNDLIQQVVCCSIALLLLLCFTETGSSIATTLDPDSAAAKAVVADAVAEMKSKNEGGDVLKRATRIRKVTVSCSRKLSNQGRHSPLLLLPLQIKEINIYYLTLYVSSSEEDSSEVCEVTLEENLAGTKGKTLQSLRCFTTDDAESLGIVRISTEELTGGLVHSATLASLAAIDAESVSKFQLKVIGHSVFDSSASVDSGTRDIKLRIGLVPTLCIKRTESDEEDSIRSCTVDSEKEPSICSITLTQWPWVTEGYLFSDLSCQSSDFKTIGEQLEPFSDEDNQSSEEAGVGEVDDNAVPAERYV